MMMAYGIYRAMAPATRTHECDIISRQAASSHHCTEDIRERRGDTIASELSMSEVKRVVMGTTL